MDMHFEVERWSNEILFLISVTDCFFLATLDLKKN